MSCLTDSVLTVRGGYHVAAEPHAMVLARGDPVRVSGTELAVRITQHYRIVEASGPRGPWKVSTAAYWYSLEQLDEWSEIIAFHWHPAGRTAITTPHLHLGPAAHVGRGELARAHIPTSRVAIEDFVWLLIQEFGARPQRDDWADVLDAAQETFNEWRTW